jgi:hypothetical protein
VRRLAGERVSLDELASVWTTPSGAPMRPDPARVQIYAAARARLEAHARA